MKQKSLNLSQPMISDVAQLDVDFVIPRVGIDLPLGIDPFLLYKSRDHKLENLHNAIISPFNAAIESLRNKDIPTATYLLDLPEVPEIGLGYTTKGKRGSGVGSYLTQLIIETLNSSPALLERGVRHVEEMQLVAIRIAADRTSDIAANFIKEYLIDYTQQQCKLWDIELKPNVPVHHIFNLQTYEWYDTYTDLPISPVDSSPIIFVPRRIVRSLPWINYADYFRNEFSAYLRAKEVKKTHKKQSQPLISKQEVISINRTEVERIDHYIDRKEATAEQARPSMDYYSRSDLQNQADVLKQKLTQLNTGATDA
ncbi:MAG: hypothetical protein AAF639_31395, partial [Chloroflexota bacterium]